MQCTLKVNIKSLTHHLRDIEINELRRQVMPLVDCFGRHLAPMFKMIMQTILAADLHRMNHMEGLIINNIDFKIVNTKIDISTHGSRIHLDEFIDSSKPPMRC